MPANPSFVDKLHWIVQALRAGMTRLRQCRLWIMWIGAAAVIGWYYATDPDHGAETVARLQWLAWLVVLAGPVYLLRRALMDGARSNAAYRKALEHPIGAGLAFVGLCLLTGLLFLAFAVRAQASQVEQETSPLQICQNGECR